MPAQSLAGPMDPAVKVIRWVGSEKKSLVWVHEALPDPFTLMLDKAFPNPEELDFNLIAIRMPYHVVGEVRLMDAGVSLSRYSAVMATTLVLIQAVIEEVDGPVLLAGYSLGAFNVGRYHPMWNSAGVYVPIIGGTAMGDICPTLYPEAVHIQQHAERIAAQFNTREVWASTAPHDNVFPVFGRYDLILQLEVQAPSFGDMVVEVWEMGHAGPFLKSKLVRKKLLHHLQAIPASHHSN